MQTEFKDIRDGDWMAVRQAFRRFQERLAKLEGYGGETTRYASLKMNGGRIRSGPANQETAENDEFITKAYLDSQEASLIINNNLKKSGKAPLRFPEAAAAAAAGGAVWTDITYSSSDFRGDGSIPPAGNFTPATPDVWGYWKDGDKVTIVLAMWGTVVAPATNVSEIDVILPTAIKDVHTTAGQKWDQGYIVIPGGVAYLNTSTDISFYAWIVTTGGLPCLALIPQSFSAATQVWEAGTYDIFFEFTYRLATP